MLHSYAVSQLNATFFACGSMVLPYLMCAIFPRGARENRTQKEIWYRSAEGSARQLRKSYK
jgi:hypothetical protein